MVGKEMEKLAEQVAKQEEEKAKKQQRKHRDLAEDVVAFTGEANAQHSSTKPYARTATSRDI